MKTNYFLSLIVVSLSLIGCSDSDNNSSGVNPPDPPIEITPRHDITLSRSEGDVVKAQQDFAFNFLELLGANLPNQNDNILVAPYSAATALSLLSNGATERELDELLSELGVTDKEQLNTLSQKLYAELTGMDPLCTVKIANSLWINPGMTFYEDFASVANHYYFADTFKADFSQQEAVDAFNQWFAQHTDGLIKKVMNEMQGGKSLVIANANLFKGKWSQPFDSKLTKADAFHGRKGNSSIDMMSMNGGYYETKIEGSRVCRIPYGNGAFRMTVILPDANVSSSTLSCISKESWNKINSQSFKGSKHVLKLPKFSLSYSNDDLLQILAQKMPTAFGPTNTYPYLAYDEVGHHLSVTKVTHNVVVCVDEEGTKAAGATSIETEFSAPAQWATEDFIVNRPFAFVIDEVSTGSILFIGAVNDL